jgi:predicted AAA+ superfamily ATPase
MANCKDGADRIPDELQTLQGALYRLSHLCVGLSGRERDLFRSLVQSLIQQASANIETGNGHRQIFSAYWKLNAWAVEVVVADGVEAVGPAIRESLIERICSSPHPFLVQCERRDPQRVTGYLRQLFCRDISALQKLAQTDWKELVEKYCSQLIEENGGATDDIVEPVSTGDTVGENSDLQLLKGLLRTAQNWDVHWLDIACFVNKYALPPFRGVRAFHIKGNEGGVNLVPVRQFASFSLNWLEGNEERTDIIMRNTRSFLAGYRAHNVLIWGPRGGGKSSLIRGLIDLYYDQGLRGIEVAPEDYSHLREVFDLVRGRREFYIGVLDNISISRGDSALHHLSRMLDGGLEAPPSNFVFYATSNFKDLVDRAGVSMQGLGTLQMDEDGIMAKVSKGIRPEFYDPQQNQRIDELRALDDRFALKVFIDLPHKNEYEHMVLAYAARAGLDMPADELFSLFNKWCMRHNHDLVGGRTARDFVLGLVLNLHDKRCEEDETFR